MHLTLSCNSKTVEDPWNLVVPFSTSNMEMATIDNSLVLSFTNVSDNGFVLLKKNPEYKECLEISVKNVEEKITKGLQSDLIKPS